MCFKVYLLSLPFFFHTKSGAEFSISHEKVGHVAGINNPGIQAASFSFVFHGHRRLFYLVLTQNCKPTEPLPSRAPCLQGQGQEDDKLLTGP